MALKEKVKKYIQDNYPETSIAQIAQRFACSIREVEDYIFEELKPERIINKKEAVLVKQSQNPWYKKLSCFNNLTITLLLLCLIALVFALNISQMSNNDIWMHLKNGELILKNRGFLYQDTYSFRTIGMDWVNHEWLAGVIFYLVNKIYHVNALIFFKAFLVTILTLFMVAGCRLTKNRWTILYPIVVFALFNAGVRFLDRPHMFTFFFIPIFFYILFAYKYRHKDYLFWLPVLSILWVNIHGGFVVGMGIITLFTTFETIRTILNRYLPFRQNDLLSMARLKKLWIIWLISGLALSLNPHGISIYTYPFELTSKQIFMTQIYEWQPPFKSPTFQRSYAFIYFLVWMGLLGLSFLCNWRHFDITNAVLAGLFVAMSLKMHRNISDFALATAPIMSLNFDQFFDVILRLKEKIRSDLLLKIALLIICTGITVMSFKHGYIYRKGSNKPFGLGVASNMPIAAVKYIKENNIKGNCFNPYTYGTYIIYHLYPDTRVVMDSRDLPYGEKLYLEHQYAMSNVEAFKEMFQKYQIDYILLNYRSGDMIDHFKYLEKTGQWVLVYFDDQNLVYIRNILQNKKLIDKDGYFVLHPSLTFEKGGVESGYIPRCIKECNRSLEQNPRLVIPRIILQNIYLAQGKFQEAVEQGEKIVEIEPGNPRSQFVLAETYKRMGAFEKALEHGQTMVTLDPHNGQGYIFLGDIFKEMNKIDQSKNFYLKALEIQPQMEQIIRKKLDELS